MAVVDSGDVALEAGHLDIDIPSLTLLLGCLHSYNVDLVLDLPGGQSLYHYTNLGGALGIVQNHDLWLTHSRYSNDDEEMSFGHKVVSAVVRQKLEEHRGDQERLAYLNRLAELVEAPVPQGVYVCCFCMKDDLLSQWRSYGANGTGVSLEFDPSGFQAMTGPECPHGLLRFWRVFYDHGEQQTIIANVLRLVWDQYEGQPTEILARKAAAVIRFFVPTFKHGDFREEEEWRLIFTPGAASAVKPRYRTARNMLVPYYSLHDLAGQPPVYQQLPIQGLRVGPSAQKSLNVESFRMMLSQSGYGTVPVRASETPYRG